MDSESINEINLHKLEGRRVFIIAAIASAVVITFLSALNRSNFVTFITIGLEQKVEFNVRELLNRSPPTSPRLKLSAIDNKTFTYLNGPSPSFVQWAELLENIAAKKPHVILIDKMFTIAPDDTPENKDALQRIRNIDVPIITGVYPFESLGSSFQNMYQVQLTEDHYGIKSLHKNHPQIDDNNLPKFESRPASHIYGPSRELADVFYRFGHVVYHKKRIRDQDGMVPPVIEVAGKRFVPHLALYAADTLAVDKGKLVINGYDVPLNPHGLVDFNHKPTQTYRVGSLYYMLKRAEEKIPERTIEQNDVVLIFSQFTTGNTDFHEGGPFGEIPGGFLVAYLVDSVLNRDWLNRPDIDEELIGIMSVAGLLVGFFAGPILFWIILISSSSIYFLGSMYLFSYYNLVIPWMLPIVGFVGCSSIQYGYQSIQNEFKKLAIKRDFYLEKAKRLEEENKKILLEESLALGKAVQDLLLPKNWSGRFNQFAYKTKYTPSQVMSGDWIFFWDASSDERRIVLGDVMGKGPSAAIPMAVIVGTITECQQQDFTLEETICRINKRLIDLFAGNITTTCASVSLHKTGKVDLYNAGSPGWFLFAPNKNLILPLRSNPLGVSLEFTPARQTIEPEKDSTLITFTDGYLEGGRAIRKLIRKISSKNIKEHDIEDIHQTLLEVGEGHRLQDDHSMLAIKVY